MNKKEAFELLSLIEVTYPSFTISQKKIDVWAELLKDQDADRIMYNAKNYAVDNKFPPTISDLRVRKTEANNKDFLDKVDKWRAEATGRNPLERKL